ATVPQTRADAGRYAFGLTSTMEPLEPPANPSDHVAQEELKSFWMQFKKDECRMGTSKIEHRTSNTEPPTSNSQHRTAKPRIEDSFHVSRFTFHSPRIPFH